MVLSSNKMSSLRKQVVLLKLQLEKSDGTVEERMVELNRDELDALVEKMGNADAVVRQLTTNQQ